MSDRHYALFALNQHPMQLQVYDEYNHFLQNLHDKTAAEAAEEDVARMQEVSEEKMSSLNTAEGESLSTEDISDIYMQVMSERRSKSNFSLNTTAKDGSVADYLEQRRPFGTSQ
jgi:hypothetical protein